MDSARQEPRSERQRRRSYDAAFKRTLVEKTLEPGASVARIAREHGINTNQLFTWRRRQLRSEQNAPPDSPEGNPPSALIPVRIMAEDPTCGSKPSPAISKGEIEIHLGRVQIYIRGAADAATLQVILASLRR